MTDRITEPRDANARLAHVLACAVEGSPKPRYAIAKCAGLHKETLMRALRGDKPISIQQASRILGACDVPVNATLALVLSGHEELASEWMHNEMGYFLERFFAALPDELDRALGERICELRPQWAIGSSRLVASLLSKHMEELAGRDIALLASR